MLQEALVLPILIASPSPIPPQQTRNPAANQQITMPPLPACIAQPLGKTLETFLIEASQSQPHSALVTPPTCSQLTEYQRY